ncbi:MAG: hypothetical protein ACRD32_02910 [Nitrososphaerales archaeon]
MHPDSSPTHSAALTVSVLLHVAAVSFVVNVAVFVISAPLQSPVMARSSVAASGVASLAQNGP